MEGAGAILQLRTIRCGACGYTEDVLAEATAAGDRALSIPHHYLGGCPAATDEEREAIRSCKAAVKYLQEGRAAAATVPEHLRLQMLNLFPTLRPHHLQSGR